MRQSIYLAPAMAAAMLAAPAHAGDIAIKPTVDARLRYEHVGQDGLPIEDSDAVTLRLRGGVIATTGPWSALVEGQGTLAILGDYYDGLHGTATRPLVADPENVALYRAQIQYKAKTLTVTAGRQRISLDDDRFVDSGLFRDNAVTFDAVRSEWTGVKRLRADVTYAWNARTVWGTDGNGARPTAIKGNNVFAELGYATPVGMLTGYSYLVDQDEAAVQGFRLSNQTYGVRLKGNRPLGKAKLAYELSYARQSDYRNNPNDYSAEFYLADATLDISPLKFGAGYEVDDADKGVALTSFQFPVGSGFRYRGWAGKFNPTPPDGVRDLYGSAGWSVKKLGPLADFALQAVYHRFESDRLVRHYGDELDLLASGKLGKCVLAVRYARYDADTFATDTRKFWLQLDMSL